MSGPSFFCEDFQMFFNAGWFALGFSWSCGWATAIVAMGWHCSVDRLAMNLSGALYILINSDITFKSISLESSAREAPIC
jgi:hypothetical protein